MYPNIESPSGGGASANWQTRLPSTFDKSKIPAGADNFFKDGTVIVFTKGGQAMQGGKFTENGDPYNPTGSENANKPVDGGNGNGTVARTGGAGAGTGAGNGAGGAGGSSSMFQYGFSQNTSGDIGASFINGNYYIDPNKFMGASANFGVMSSLAQMMPFGLGPTFANMTMGGILNGFMKSIGFNFDFSHFNAQSTTTTTTTTTGTTTTDGTSTTTTTTTGTTTTSGTTTGNPEYRAVAGSNGKVFAKTENGATVHYIKQGENYVKVEHYDNQSQSYYYGGKKYNTDGKQMLAYSTVSEFEKTHPNGYTKVGSSYTVDGTTYVYDDDGKLTQVKDAKGNVQEVTTNNTKEAVKKQIENLGLEKATTEVEKDKITITIKGAELIKIAGNPDFAPPGLDVFSASKGVMTSVIAGAMEGMMAANPDLNVTVTFNFDNKGQLTSKELSSNIPNPDNTLTVFDPSKKTQFKVSYNYDNYADGALRTKK